MQLMGFDALNSVFQATGGILTFLHVKEVVRFQTWRGAHWGPVLFYFLWGVWSVAFYGYLGFPLSTAASAMPALGNGAYLLVMWRYR